MGEGREKRREILMETLMGFLLHMPQPRPEPATQARALTGNQTGDLSCMLRDDAQLLSHIGLGLKVFLI